MHMGNHHHKGQSVYYTYVYLFASRANQNLVYLFILLLTKPMCSFLTLVQTQLNLALHMPISIKYPRKTDIS